MPEPNAQSALTPRPAHIPKELEYDFDLFLDRGLRADAHKRILEIAREAPPVFWTPRNGGHWMLRGYEAVFEASRDTETFTSEAVPQAQIRAMEAALPPGSPPILQPIPISVDPPEHGKYRAPLNTAFSPKVIMAMKEDVRELAVDLIEKVRARGRCEFMSEIAEPLPVTLFLRIFGLPVERQREYRDLAQEHISQISSPDPQATQKRLRKITALIHEPLIERRDNPKDDLISRLWKLQIDGQPMTLRDMQNYAVVLFIGGLDTVVNGLGLGVRHLALNPDLQDKLRADPKLIAEAAEEMLRRYTFTVPPRTLAKDAVFAGAAMKKGERAFLFLPAADLDASQFPDPDRYELGREGKVHIAFGVGPHRCVGSHLARLELQVLYEEFLARIPRFRLDPQKEVTFHGGYVIGPDVLNLVWD